MRSFLTLVLLLLVLTVATLGWPTVEARCARVFAPTWQPQVVRTEALSALVAPRADAAAMGAPATDIADDAQALTQTRDAIRAERARLRALGGQMMAVLDPRQAAWLARNRDDISLNRFEKPYWVRLAEAITP